MIQCAPVLNHEYIPRRGVRISTHNPEVIIPGIVHRQPDETVTVKCQLQQRVINASKQSKELQKNEQIGLLVPADLLKEEVVGTIQCSNAEKEKPNIREIFGQQTEPLSAEERENF